MAWDWGNGFASSPLLDQELQDTQDSNQEDQIKALQDYYDMANTVLNAWQGFGNFAQQGQAQFGGDYQLSPEEQRQERIRQQAESDYQAQQAVENPPEPLSFGEKLQRTATPITDAFGIYGQLNQDVPVWSDFARNYVKPGIEAAGNFLRPETQTAGLNLPGAGDVLSSFIPVGAADVGLTAAPFAPGAARLGRRGFEAVSGGEGIGSSLGRLATEEGGFAKTLNPGEAPLPKHGQLTPSEKELLAQVDPEARIALPEKATIAEMRQYLESAGMDSRGTKGVVDSRYNILRSGASPINPAENLAATGRQPIGGETTPPSAAEPPPFMRPNQPQIRTGGPADYPVVEPRFPNTPPESIPAETPSQPAAGGGQPPVEPPGPPSQYMSPGTGENPGFQTPNWEQLGATPEERLRNVISQNRLGEPGQPVDPETLRVQQDGWGGKGPPVDSVGHSQFDENWTPGRALNEVIAAIRLPIRTGTLGFHGLRMGVGEAISHPPEAWQALKDYATLLRDPSTRAAIDTRLIELPFIGGDAPAGTRWEDMPRGKASPRYPKPLVDRAIEAVPGLGNILQRNQESTFGYLNSLRKLVYNSEAERLMKLGEGVDPRMYQDAYGAVNHAGGLMSHQRNPLASTFGYSPQAMGARFMQWSDMAIGSGAPTPFSAGSRSIAIKNMLAVAGLTAAADGIGSLLGGQIGAPGWTRYGLTSETGKLIFGSTKEDWAAGQGPILRLFVNLARDVDQGGKQMRSNLITHLGNYASGQLGPVPQEALNLFSGYDAVGNPVSPKDLLTLKTEREIWAPIAANSIIDALTTPGGNIAAALPSFGAVSVQTSEPKATGGGGGGGGWKIKRSTGSGSGGGWKVKR